MIRWIYTVVCLVNSVSCGHVWRDLLCWVFWRLDVFGTEWKGLQSIIPTGRVEGMVSEGHSRKEMTF